MLQKSHRMSGHVELQVHKVNSRYILHLMYLLSTLHGHMTFCSE